MGITRKDLHNELRTTRREPARPSGNGRRNGLRLPSLPPLRRGGSDGPDGPRKPRLKKLRAAFVVLVLVLIALAAWVWGVMMAVAGDLPSLETREQYLQSENSVVLDRNGNELATLTGNERRILVDSGDISPFVKNAVVAIEDTRFYDHRGVDYLGIARALREDILAGDTVQGGSTITQQFIKDALEAQGDRTVLQKLREAALAYHIERQWSKDKILTNYLNNVYFGEGAYGIEVAAQTYFGEGHPGCGGGGDSCASQLRPEEAALLAAVISSPSLYSPRENAEAAKDRRNLVLDKMLEQGTLDPETHANAVEATLPAPSAIKPPKEESEAPFFTSWLRQQLVDKYGAGRTFGGGLEVTSTLDLEVQRAAEQAVAGRLTGLGPAGAAVVIDNKSGGVLAMVGGQDFDEQQFNLATNGHRQPGSAFKPFTLVTALEEGRSPEEVFASQPKEIQFENRVKRKNGTTKTVPELFKVANYEDSYLGSASLRAATTYSDNSVYAELGHDLGERNIAETARRMGIETRLSKNPAMILGGLKRGVTPLEMTYAYSTLANGGRQVSGTMGSDGNGAGPVGIDKVQDSDGDPVEDQLGASGKNEETAEPVLEPGVGEQAVEILGTVVSQGTGTAASTGDDSEWGKTGTTDDNVDAWFCGGNDDVTACVWVGHPDGSTPMETEFGGQPVDGGTIPALIWRDLIATYDSIAATRDAAKEAEEDAEDAEEGTEEAPSAPAPAAPAPEADSEAVPAETPEEEAPSRTQEQSAPPAQGNQPPRENAPPASPPPADGGPPVGGGDGSTGGGASPTE